MIMVDEMRHELVTYNNKWGTHVSKYVPVHHKVARPILEKEKRRLLIIIGNVHNKLAGVERRLAG